MKTLHAASLCFLALAAPAVAAPLTVVDVGAPAINCVFNPTCTVVVTDSPGAITLPANIGSGNLQSRTFDSATGAPAFPLHGYDWRVDMTQAKGKNCVSAMRIEVGAIATLDYKPGTPAQLYVVTSGGLGSVGIGSADLTGGVLSIKFHGAVCPGSTSYFFGLAAKGTPVNTKASLTPTVPGPVVIVPARAP
jgi:hypothetical protein